MPLPVPVLVRLDLYTLACRELLQRLPQLHDATLGDTRESFDNCLGRFNKATKAFIQESISVQKETAADLLGSLLTPEAKSIRQRNGDAAAVFEDLVIAINKPEKLTAWHHLQDLRYFHSQGRELARRFYADSPFQETKANLELECDLAINHGLPDDDDYRSLRAEPFGWKIAPLVFHPFYPDYQTKKEVGRIIELWFDADDDFTKYLAYPFLFMHEYLAHVYGTDHDNEKFNDGWLLHAAEAFLIRAWNATSGGLGLNLYQVNIFHDRLYQKISGAAREGAFLARHLDPWIDGHEPGLFSRLTHEMAAFNPQLGESPQLLNHLIFNLYKVFQPASQAATTALSRRRLLDKLHSSTNIRELLANILRE